jgi:hypothetical protein
MFTYTCKSVEDMMRHCHEISMKKMSGQWCFRGQASSTWTLKPRLWRDPKKDGITDFELYEKTTLGAMRAMAGHTTTFPSRLLEDPDFVLALAQHYRAKTRLLDWTYDPSTALYFAVSGALQSGTVDQSKSFSIFILASIYISLGSSHERDENKRATILQIPIAANANMAAQKGLLIRVPWLKDMWDGEKAQATDDPSKNVSALVDSRLMRLDLSYKHLSYAVDYLHKRNVYGTTIYPGTHGLAAFAEDEAHMMELLLAEAKQEEASATSATEPEEEQ